MSDNGINERNITLSVLAGGAGTRMGLPKADLIVQGKPILQFLLERFAWIGPTLLVTAPGRERPRACELFDREVVDPIAGEGPMRGVLTALEAAATEIVIVATVDMPEVAREQLLWLANELDGDAVFARRVTGKIEPFPSAFRTSARNALRARLSESRREMHALLQLQGFVAVDAPERWSAAVWRNLNRPSDL